MMHRGNVRVPGSKRAHARTHTVQSAKEGCTVPQPEDERMVQIAKSGQLTVCIDVLAQAFSDDPLMAYIWPDATRRRAALYRWFAISIRGHHFHSGRVDFTGTSVKGIEAVAVWDSPGQWQTSATSTVRSFPKLLSALRTRIPAALHVRKTLDAHHPDRPHWYLSNIGTLSSARGQGLAGALLEHQLAECDRTETPAYLVCTMDRNIGLYEHFGFTVTEEFSLEPATPLWSMWREPAHQR